ncbi:inositol monophosphatase [Chloroflexia bacterium SDU3-3]|nr:inositol monophosphatase [Chloroflexia bacterium SDU3-3]
MSIIDIDEVRGWAEAAGRLALQHFNHVAGHRKADRSYVTEADVAIERQLVAQISARYPDHGILGEEQAKTNLDREFVWAVDPIDGTASFVAGLGSWCISIGLVRNGQPYFGLIHMPTLGDTYHAAVGEGAFLNGQPIHVSQPDAWEGETWLATPATLHRSFELDFPGKTRVLGSTAAQMCYVARGSALAALLVNAYPWDVAAGLVIVQEAGGAVVPLDPATPTGGTALDGGWLHQPVLVAAPDQIAPLRQAFRRR